MKKVFVFVVCVGILGGAIWYASSRPEKSQQIIEEETGSRPEEMVETPRSVTFPVYAQNDSGESGAVILVEAGGQTQVVIDLSDVPADITQPAHIHTGSCAEIGEVKYPLTGVQKAETGLVSQTTLDVSFEQFMSELPLAINVHKSQEESGVYVACGDVLGIQDLQIGTGPEAKNGDVITVHYTGTLTDGTKFDSSVDAGKPFVFQLGVSNVITGWHLGVEGMRVGGVRKLTIPSELAYGAQGAGGGVIPPNATLIFEVSLLSIQGKE